MKPSINQGLKLEEFNLHTNPGHDLGLQSQKEVEEKQVEPLGPTQLGTDPDEWLTHSKER